MHNDGLSRAVRRRIEASNALKKRVNGAISALNSLWFGGSLRYRAWEIEHMDGLPLAQRDALSHIQRCVRDLGPPPDGASRQGALQALRAASCSYTEPEPGVGSVVDMDLHRLSLPTGAVAGVSLVDQLEGPVRDMVQNFEEYMLQDSDVWTSMESLVASVPPYNDKLLRRHYGYLQFIKHLYECGVLGFTSCCKGRVGAFSVSKKPKVVNGITQPRQRLVLDCRQTNLLFKDPPLTELGSLAALGRLKLQEHEKLYAAGADIRDCFYAANCPPGMSDYSCLARDLTEAEAKYVTGGRETLTTSGTGSYHASPFCLWGSVGLFT